MKKISSIAAVILFALALASCKKTQTCTCNYSGKDTVSNRTIVYPLGSQTNVSASSDCDNLESTLSKSGAIAGWDCHI